MRMIINPNELEAEVDRNKVFEKLSDERTYQDARWPGHKHEVGSYLTLMATYLRKAQDAWSRNDGDVLALHEVRKLTALGVACMEEHGVPTRPGQETR